MINEIRDIVIYMNTEDFKHKTQKDITAYWSMSRPPKYFEDRGNVFLAQDGLIRGYVKCLEFNPDDPYGETVVWEGKSFRSIKAIPCKPFRGFRYRWFDFKPEERK